MTMNSVRKLIKTYKNFSIILVALICNAATYSHPDTSQKATTVLIAYLDTLVSKNMLSIGNLQELVEHEILVNPIAETQAFSSNTAFMNKKQLDQIITSDAQSVLNVSEIKRWAQEKILELEKHAIIQERVYKKTQSIRRSMEFIPVPEGTYESSFDQSSFTITAAIELQDTPVTQHQWATVMGYNPSQFKDGGLSEELVFNNKKIKIRNDAPVESITHADIQTFIDRLNSEDSLYSYALPSLDEYDAFLQTFINKNWVSKLIKSNRCLDTEQTCQVGSTSFIARDGIRCWDLCGNVLQWTRDKIYFPENTSTVGLLFGTSYGGSRNIVSMVSSLIRPLFYPEHPHENVGFRLIRFKKNHKVVSSSKIYDRNTLHWEQDQVPQDLNSQWDPAFRSLVLHHDGIRLMVENKDLYTEDIQHTLDILKTQIYCDMADFHCIDNKDWFYIGFKKISNLLPLAYFRNLKALTLASNEITDITALKRMFALEKLDISKNQIKNVTALTKLLNLTDLTAYENQINNITALSNLTRLESLWLFTNEIEKIDSLTNLSNLSRLALGSNKIKDVKPIAHLTKLKDLTLEFNQIEDITALRNLYNLSKLDLRRNKIKYIQTLSYLSNLKKLSIGWGNQIEDITPLDQLRQNGCLVEN